MADLNTVLSNFSSKASPSNADDSAPATAGDIRNLIAAIVELERVLIRERFE